MDDQNQGFFARIRAFFEVERQNRLQELNTALESAPDNASLYLLRGEVWLELGEISSAIADFQVAIELAEATMPQARWGYLFESVAQRARENLRRCGTISEELV